MGARSVTLYGTATCPYCVMAKQLLTSKGLTPVEIDVGRDPALRDEMLARSGRRTVPQIFFGEHHVGGYDDLVALERLGQIGSAL